jgi:hypothetical protein
VSKFETLLYSQDTVGKPMSVSSNARRESSFDSLRVAFVTTSAMLRIGHLVLHTYTRIPLQRFCIWTLRCSCDATAFGLVPISVIWHPLCHTCACLAMSHSNHHVCHLPSLVNQERPCSCLEGCWYLHPNTRLPRN